MNYAIRTPLVLPLAAAITVGLFLMMRALIDIGPVPVFEAEAPPDIEIVIGVVEREPDRSQRARWVEPADPPPPPDMDFSDRADPAQQDFSPPAAPPPLGSVDVEVDPRPVAADGNPIPVVRREPFYPDRMAQRRIEGQCTLVFDIMPDGRTANVRTLNCSNTGFEQASIRAVEGWRYSPQVRNGQPEVYRGATTQLIYRMDG